MAARYGVLGHYGQADRSRLNGLAVKAGTPISAEADFFLQQALFVFLLAGNTVPRPRHRFEALQLQFFFALHAGSEFVVLDSLERFINQLQHGPVGIGLAEQELLRVRVGSLVGEIYGRIIVRGPPFLLGARDASQQFLAARDQLSFVVFETFLIHSHGPTIRSNFAITNG